MSRCPGEPAYRFDLIRCHERLGFTLCDMARQREAEAVLRQALTLAESLAADFPAELRYQRLVVQVCVNLGIPLFNSCQFEELRWSLVELEIKRPSSWIPTLNRRSTAEPSPFAMATWVPATSKWGAGRKGNGTFEPP